MKYNKSCYFAFLAVTVGTLRRARFVVTARMFQKVNAACLTKVQRLPQPKSKPQLFSVGSDGRQILPVGKLWNAKYMYFPDTAEGRLNFQKWYGPNQKRKKRRLAKKAKKQLLKQAEKEFASLTNPAEDSTQVRSAEGYGESSSSSDAGTTSEEESDYSLCDSDEEPDEESDESDEESDEESYDSADEAYATTTLLQKLPKKQEAVVEDWCDEPYPSDSDDSFYEIPSGCVNELSTQQLINLENKACQIRRTEPWAWSDERTWNKPLSLQAGDELTVNPDDYQLVQLPEKASHRREYHREKIVTNQTAGEERPLHLRPFPNPTRVLTFSRKLKLAGDTENPNEAGDCKRRKNATSMHVLAICQDKGKKSFTDGRGRIIEMHGETVEPGETDFVDDTGVGKDVDDPNARKILESTTYTVKDLEHPCHTGKGLLQPELDEHDCEVYGQHKSQPLQAPEVFMEIEGAAAESEESDSENDDMPICEWLEQQNNAN